MEARARAAKRAGDLAVYQAWHTAVFGVRAYGGKLKGLEKYLATPPRKAQTADDMLAAFQQLAARNPISIRQIN